jgi:predicted RNA binding protein YcfA (HicA-like mRNA interferase family)
LVKSKRTRVIGVIKVLIVGVIGVIITSARNIGDFMTSEQLIAELKKDGWQVKRTKGSHHQLKHAKKPGTITVPHPKKELGIGLIRAIKKQAGLL